LFASEFGGGCVAEDLGHRWDQDAGGDVALDETLVSNELVCGGRGPYSVATTFTTLGTDDIGTKLKTFLHMLHMANHVLERREEIRLMI